MALFLPTRRLKTADLSQTVFVLSTNEAYELTADMPTIAKGDNATRYISRKKHYSNKL